MTTPLISVIVPVYRVEKYLERCVKSILSQNYKNLEVIKIEEDFEKTQALSEEVTLESLSKLPMAHRLGGYLFSLIGPLM